MLGDHRLIGRSLVVALIVGTVLVGINRGNRVFDGDFAGDLYWKIPLTYIVPYLVATLGALLNTRE